MMMKKNKPLLCAFIAGIIFFWGMAVPNGFAGIGDGLTDKEKRRLFGETKRLMGSLMEISRALKKANIRLQDLEATDIENLKQTHAEMLSQIETIQKLIPSLQGIIELNQTELTRQINTGLTRMNSNLDTQKQQRVEEQEKFRQGVLDDMGQLRRELKGDMESFAKLNKQSFDEFSRVNSKALREIVASLNEQNQKMAETNSTLISLLRTELVPALVKQNETNLNTLLSRLAGSEEKILQTLQTSHGAMVQNFSGLDSKNDKMVEILKQSLEEQKTTRQQGDLMNNNLMLADGKISHIAEALEVLKNQNNSVGNSLNSLHAGVARLQEITNHAEENISRQNDVTLKAVETYSGQLGQKLDQSLAQAEAGAANDKLAREKIDKMIDILQTAADRTAIEEKLDQAILKIETDQANVNLANEKLSKLIEILKTIVAAQGGLEQVQKDQGALNATLADLNRKINVAIARNDDIKKEQKKIRDALADLRRKANVNISRNDEIKKYVKKIQKAIPASSR